MKIKFLLFSFLIAGANFVKAAQIEATLEQRQLAYSLLNAIGNTEELSLLRRFAKENQVEIWLDGKSADAFAKFVLENPERARHQISILDIIPPHQYIYLAIRGDKKNVSNFWSGIHGIYAYKLHGPTDSRWKPNVLSSITENSAHYITMPRLPISMNFDPSTISLSYLRFLEERKNNPGPETSIEEIHTIISAMISNLKSPKGVSEFAFTEWTEEITEFRLASHNSRELLMLLGAFNDLAAALLIAPRDRVTQVESTGVLTLSEQVEKRIAETPMNIRTLLVDYLKAEGSKNKNSLLLCSHLF